MEINIEELKRPGNIRISVVGVGGGGSNAINHLSVHDSYLHESIKLIAVNTDVQHLNEVSAHIKIQIGEKTTEGLGAGMYPEKGRKSAEESADKIKEELRDSNIIFITTGLGGGTGTGATPVIAKIARELNALTIAIVTKPFAMEGKSREKIAEQGLRELKKEVDTIIVIPNDRVLAITSKSLGIGQCLKLIDDVLAQAVKGVSGFILGSSNGGANVDYADLKRTMEFNGLGLIGIGEADGEDAAIEAVEQAMQSPLLDNISIKGAKAAILHVEINKDYPLASVNDAGNIVEQQLEQNGDELFKLAWSFNDALPPTKARVTLVVTGFEKSMITDETNINLTSDSLVQQSLESHASHDEVINKIQLKQLKRVSGLNESVFNEQDLDRPSFLRNQRD